MNYLSFLTCLVLATQIAFCANPIRSDKDRLQGEWRLKSAIQGGKPSSLTPQEMRLIELLVKGNKATISFKRDEIIGPIGEMADCFEKPIEVEIALDDSKTPKHIDFAVQYLQKSFVIPGIYKLEGEELTICINEKNDWKIRPRSFQSARGDNNTVYVVTRHTPDRKQLK